MSEPRLHHVQCLNPKGLHRMAYWEWGDAANPRVLLCVHGLTRQGRDFDTLARSVSHQFRVVCPDVVGRGVSDWLPDPAGYQVTQYVADMVTLVARLDVAAEAEVAWVGTSMGGLIGMGLASLPNSPITKLVLNDVGPAIEAASLLRIGSYLGQPVQWPSLDEAADALWAISSGFGPHTREQWLALCTPQLKQRPDGAWVSRYDPGIAVGFRSFSPEMAKAGEAALWQAYDAIRCPTLLVRGAQSDLLSPATARAMTQRGPKATLVELPGIGHAPTLVPPDQVQLVASFLAAGGT